MAFFTFVFRNNRARAAYFDAGGVYNTSNSGYYLYTNQSYWTMSPYAFSGSNAVVFAVYSAGTLGSNSNVYYTYGVRPVLNLKADITISSGDGTSGSPFVIS